MQFSGIKYLHDVQLLTPSISRPHSTRNLYPFNSNRLFYPPQHPDKHHSLWWVFVSVFLIASSHFKRDREVFAFLSVWVTSLGIMISAVMHAIPYTRLFLLQLNNIHKPEKCPRYFSLYSFSSLNTGPRSSCLIQEEYTGERVRNTALENESPGSCFLSAVKRR